MEERSSTASSLLDVRDYKFKTTLPKTDDFAVRTSPDIPTEGKKAWLTLLLVFSTNFILGFYWIAFSVLYKYVTDDFGTSKATGGWIVSLQGGVTQLFAVLVSPGVTVFGCRKMAVTGAIICFLANAFSAISPTIWLIVILYGFITGIGLSMLYLTCAVIIQKQFHKNRALACGIAMLGLSFGNVTGPVVTELMVLHYGWRGAVLLHAGVLANTIVLGLLFPSKQEEDLTLATKYEDVNDNKQNANTMHTVVEYFKHLVDFSVLKNPAFVLFSISFMCLMFNVIPFWNHLVSRAVFYGADQSRSSSIISFAFFGTVISRIMFSFIANLKCSNYILMFSIGLLFGGLSSYALTFTVDFYMMLVICIFFGFHIGCSVTVVTVSAVYLLGAEKIARSQAFLSFFHGIAALTSVPFSGWLFDVTNNYNLPYYVNGTVAIVGSILSFIAFILSLKYKFTTNSLQQTLRYNSQFIGSMEIYQDE